MDVRSGSVCIVGAGVSGRALALWAKKLGADVFVTEKRPELQAETRELFERYSVRWETGGHSAKCCDCGLMVVSSGVPFSSEAVTMARAFGIPVAGELDFLAPWLRGKIIAVTGTNGKTTCTSLAGHILENNGLHVAVAGNIGSPLAGCAGKKYDALVLELSSFQLHWNSLLKPQVAILTNLAPDHLDWHGSYENYKADKCRIFAQPDGKSWAVVHPCDVFRVPQGREVWSLGGQTGRRIGLEGETVELVGGSERRPLFCKSALKLLGSHNLENAAMASAAVALLFPELDPGAGISTFQAPRHRCEFICRRRGVAYVDDSKGTNVAAAVTALRSIAGPKIAILGGQGKGEDYELLAEVVCEQARAAIVLGSEADRILSTLDRVGYAKAWKAGGMAEAVQKASELAQPGDIVLLSPACTSWDMYKNYGERGDHFAALVRSLP